MISAIILAAGASKRMGRPKAHLTYQGETFLQRALQTFQNSTVDELIVVTGAHREESDQATCVWNPDHASGMMSSIQAGVRALNPKSDAFIISLVDMPLLTPHDIQALIQGFSGYSLARYEKTHPVMISKKLIPDILQAAREDRGCAFLFEKYPAFILKAPKHLLVNINTLEDYHAHITP